MISKCFSSYAKNSRTAGRLFSFKYSDLKVELSKDNSPVKLDIPSLKFGYTHSRHMFEVDYKNGKWETPTIRPFQNLSIHPFNITLHYALTCFEGMKAYKDPKGGLRLFRPMENMKRFESSCDRLVLPKFDKTELLKCLEELVRVDKDWVPSEKGASLYLRPFAFGMDEELGVKVSKNAKLMIVCSPVGPYYSTGVKPTKLAIYREYERGSPKSAAGYKLGSNYGPTCKITDDLAQKGYNQALWVHDDNILEIGASNIFFLLKGQDGKRELITPPLDGSVLPGITRKSIIEIAEAEHKDVNVSVREFTVSELKKAFDDGRVLEIFGAGTAVCISPVAEICKRIFLMIHDFDRSSD